MQTLFGRTNEDFPRVWLQPRPSPEEPPELLAEFLASSGAAVEPSSSPSLWGHLLRSRQETPMILRLGPDYERATDASHAAALIQASLLSLLSSLGRDRVDFVFLPVRRMAEERQISGALEGLESARQEGLVRFFGLEARGHELAVLSFWQFHDAFEAILMERGPDERSFQALAPLAASRRTAVAVHDPCLELHGEPSVQAEAQRCGVSALGALTAFHAKAHAVLAPASTRSEARDAAAWQESLHAADQVRQAASLLLGGAR